MTISRNWRRTRLTRTDGSPIPDDWTLEDEAGQPLGRIYAETGGPQGGRWFWAVQVAPDGVPFNGGTGHAASGKEVREARVQERWRGRERHSETVVKEPIGRSSRDRTRQ